MPYVVFRFLLGLLLLAGLGSCSVYDRIFRPYHIGTPPPSPEYLAKLKADKEKKKANASAQKAREKSGDTSEPIETISVEGNVVPANADPNAPKTVKEPLKAKKLRYDKNGIIKKPKLIHRRYHKPARKPFRPWQSIRHFFKYNLHAKPNYKKHPAVPAADAPPAAPEPTATPAPPTDPTPAPAPKP